MPSNNNPVVVPDHVIRFCGLAYVGIIILTTLQDLSLFSLHPISMALFVFTAAESTLAFAKKNREAAAAQTAAKGGKTKEEKQNMPFSVRVDFHSTIALAAVFWGILGFGVEYYVKDMNKRAHFSTYHGFYGSLVMLMACVQGTAGWLIRYLRIRGMWRLHRLSGIVVLAMVPAIAFLHVATFTGGLIPGNWMRGNEYFFGWGLAAELLLLVNAAGVLLRSLGY